MSERHDHHNRVSSSGTCCATLETRALVYGGTLAIGILGQLAPGLMGALLVMALGAHRRNRLLFGMGARRPV